MDRDQNDGSNGEVEEEKEKKRRSSGGGGGGRPSPENKRKEEFQAGDDEGRRGSEGEGLQNLRFH